MKLAWLPPRHRNITIPLNCLWFGNYYIRLTYTASVHVQLPQWIGCWCQTLLNQLGKVFKLKFHFGNVCNSIELNDHWSAFIQSANLPAGIDIMAHEVKHLPRLILYRSVSQSSLIVRLSVDLAVLLRDDGRSHRDLSTALRRSSGLCGWGIRSRWCWIRHWCRCGWRSRRLWRWC